jgi:hypothetical protein
MDDPGYRVSGLSPLKECVDNHLPQALTNAIQTRVSLSFLQETDPSIYDETKKSKGYKKDDGCDNITGNTKDRILGGLDGGFHGSSRSIRDALFNVISGPWPLFRNGSILLERLDVNTNLLQIKIEFGNNFTAWGSE